MTVARPISCPVLVGRDDLLAHAARRLQEAADGQGSLLFLSGEAGIGKTRLLDAVMRRAQLSGFEVGEGAAFPHDADVAGAALLDLAAALKRADRAETRAVGARLDDVLAAEEESVDAGRGPGGDLHRRRRVRVQAAADALIGLVEPLAPSTPSTPSTPPTPPTPSTPPTPPTPSTPPTPMLLAVEDLHWADDVTLEVLEQVARRVRGLPLLVVATYRSDELYPRIPLREWRSRLLTRRLAEEIRLDRLDREQTAVMAGMLIGDALPPSAALVDALQQRSDGVPLHVEEILAGGATGSAVADVVPETLVDSVLARAALLSEHAKAVVEVAAVIGRTFSLDLLAEILDEPPDRTDDAVDELVRRFFVVPVAPAPDRYGFRHALIRDACYAQVPAGRRRRLHRQVADAARAAGSPSSFLATHYDLAGASAPAYEYALLAARRAVSLSAHREAVEFYRKALRHLPDAAEPADRADVLAAFAAECAATDASADAAQAFEQARALRLGAGDVVGAAALVAPLVAVRHLLGDDLPARVGRLTAALDELTAASATESAPGTATRLLAGLSDAYMLDRRLDQAIEHGERARALAVAAGDEATEVNTMATVGSCLVFAGRMAQGWTLLEQAVQQARAHRLETEAARAYRMIGSSASVLVAYDLAERWLAEGIEYAERVELWNHRHYLVAHLGHVAWATGDWPRALDLGQRALVDGRGGITTRVTALIVRGYHAMGSGDFAAASATLGEARDIGRSMGELQRYSPALWGLAETALLRGAPDEAVELCEQGRAASVAVDDAAYLFPFLLVGARAKLALHDTVGATEWVESIAQALSRRGIPGTLPAIEHGRALVALATGRTAQARTALLSAQQSWTGLRRVWEQLWAGIDLARCATRAGRVDDAVQQATQARTAAAAVGAAPLVALADEVLALARRRGGVEPVWAPLTAREFEVARLVGDGLTNREIADRLGISVKTVGAHVEHILARLGVTRRAGIASWVVSVAAEPS
ncbi:helix-turn-helix transcriptional regulator [Angustibacter sp. McL0619]|uniref:helix-turn-helix transcriptional regulator n=1 Tax=Angustibacter sp. McL0619 TaxID=3415676 RepID=UPI003CE689FC